MSRRCGTRNECNVMTGQSVRICACCVRCVTVHKSWVRTRLRPLASERSHRGRLPVGPYREKDKKKRERDRKRERERSSGWSSQILALLKRANADADVFGTLHQTSLRAECCNALTRPVQCTAAPRDVVQPAPHSKFQHTWIVGRQTSNALH